MRINVLSLKKEMGDVGGREFGRKGEREREGEREGWSEGGSEGGKDGVSNNDPIQYFEFLILPFKYGQVY